MGIGRTPPTAQGDTGTPAFPARKPAREIPAEWAVAKWSMVEAILDEGKAAKVSREGGAVIIEDMAEGTR